MGVGASALNSEVKKIALTCAFKKSSINEKLEIVKDANDVMQAYAAVLLMPQMPSALTEYKNYRSSTKAYFDAMAKVPVPALRAANSKMSSYKDFYSGLDALKSEYEKANMTDEMRRSKITDIFNLSYITMMSLVDEVRKDCKII